MEILNKTKRPLRIPLPGGKRLHLAPGKTGQISPKSADHPPLKMLIEQGEVELLGGGTLPRQRHLQRVLTQGVRAERRRAQRRSLFWRSLTRPAVGDTESDTSVSDCPYSLDDQLVASDRSENRALVGSQNENRQLVRAQAERVQVERALVAAVAIGLAACSGEV